METLAVNDPFRPKAELQSLGSILKQPNFIPGVEDLENYEFADGGESPAAAEPATAELELIS